MVPSAPGSLLSQILLSNFGNLEVWSSEKSFYS